MHHFRCLSHATVTAAALVAWGLVAWGAYDSPGPDAALRLPFFAVLGVAIVASVLALMPLVLYGPEGRRRSRDDERCIAEAFYWWGREDERAIAEGREAETEGRPAFLRLVND